MKKFLFYSLCFALIFYFTGIVGVVVSVIFVLSGGLKNA